MKREHKDQQARRGAGATMPEAICSTENKLKDDVFLIIR